MSSEISTDKVTEQVPNRFLLTVVVAKRAAQIKEELSKLGPLAGNVPHPITLALQDIAKSNVTTIAVEAPQELDAAQAAQALSDLEAAMVLEAEGASPNGFDPSRLLEDNADETATAGIEASKD